MSDLSKNFSRYEFECQDECGFDTVDTGLLRVLQDVADYYSVLYGKVKVIITSGCRCPEHNEDEGGSENSQHLYGKAADFKVYKLTNDEWEQIPAEVIYNYIDSKYPDTLGLGMYSNRNHVDSRERKARW